MVTNVRDASVIGHIWELAAGFSLYYFFLVCAVQEKKIIPAFILRGA